MEPHQTLINGQSCLMQLQLLQANIIHSMRLRGGTNPNLRKEHYDIPSLTKQRFMWYGLRDIVFVEKIWVSVQIGIRNFHVSFWKCVQPELVIVLKVANSCNCFILIFTPKLMLKKGNKIYHIVALGIKYFSNFKCILILISCTVLCTCFYPVKLIN